jgi:hypothetical protein
MTEPIKLTPILTAIQQVSKSVAEFKPLTAAQQLERTRLGNILQAIDDLVRALCMGAEGHEDHAPPPFYMPER